ncbi:hypothetical protein FB451DRAFT_1195783 [Mycena latifolia]|nr:hypothetical protein FB451DRAFT_1195783 [Mycena latifolia]
MSSWSFKFQRSPTISLASSLTDFRISARLRWFPALCAPPASLTFSIPSATGQYVIAQKLDLSRFPAMSKFVMMDQENIEDVKAVISQIPPDSRIRIIRLSASGNADPDEIREIDSAIATAPMPVLSRIEIEFAVRIHEQEMIGGEHISRDWHW